MEIPEFDIFKRLEKLEEKAAGTFTTKDTFGVAIIGFEVAFLALIVHNPKSARKWKDVLIEKLQKTGFSRHWLDILREDLTILCSFAEVED